jgi:hypothetical protein
MSKPPNQHATNAHETHGGDKPRYDDINTSLVVMVGIISAIVTYLSVVVVQAMTYQMEMNAIRQRSHDVQYVRSVQAIEAQRDQLAANPEIKRISIEQAMRETVDQFASPATESRDNRSEEHQLP